MCTNSDDAPDSVILAAQGKFWSLADELHAKVSAVTAAKAVLKSAEGDLQYVAASMQSIAKWHGEDMLGELEAILEKHGIQLPKEASDANT